MERSIILKRVRGKEKRELVKDFRTNGNGSTLYSVAALFVQSGRKVETENFAILSGPSISLFSPLLPHVALPPLSIPLHLLFLSLSFFLFLTSPPSHPDIFHTLFLFRILMNAIDINGYSTSRIYLISKRSDFSKSRDRRSDRYVIRR